MNGQLYLFRDITGFKTVLSFCHFTDSCSQYSRFQPHYFVSTFMLDDKTSGCDW